MKTFVALVSLVVLSVSVAHAQETPRMGGVLKVASIGEPPTLDIQATTTKPVPWQEGAGSAPRRREAGRPSHQRPRLETSSGLAPNRRTRRW